MEDAYSVRPWSSHQIRRFQLKSKACSDANEYAGLTFCMPKQHNLSGLVGSIIMVIEVARRKRTYLHSFSFP